MKLLVAIDSSEASQAVVQEVAARSWPSQTDVEILNVMEPAHLWAVTPTAEETRLFSTDLVLRASDELRARGLEVSGVAMQGDPKRIVLERAEATKPDLVFVGSHGGSALKRFFLGNVASAVVAHAQCSVEIVRARQGKRAGVRKILLATDGSEFAARAARSIAERPWPEGVEVMVLSVVELHLGAGQAFFEVPSVDSEHLESQRASAMKRAQNAIAEAREILANKFPKATDSISVLVDGPKTVIINEAEKFGADLIVVGSHGQRGIERFLLGSVSQGVALGAHCSVEVIR